MTAFPSPLAHEPAPQVLAPRSPCDAGILRLVAAPSLAVARAGDGVPA